MSGRDFTALFGETATYRDRIAEMANDRIDKAMRDSLLQTNINKRNDMERKYVDFNTWVAEMRQGAIGKQAGNTAQEWIFVHGTDTFTDQESQNYSEDKLRETLPNNYAGKRFWLESSSTHTLEKDKEKRDAMYKYKLNPNLALEHYIRRYRNVPQDYITYVYENPGSIISKEMLNLGQYQNNISIYNPITQLRKSIDFYSRDLILVETPLEEGMTWSNIRKRTLQFSGDHLLEQIRTRYAFFNRPTNGLSNIIIDNYAPKLMYNTKFNPTALSTVNLPKTIYAISPWFAQYFGAQQVPTEQLCRILGYDIATLKQMVTKIKHRQYSITFIGYGGTNVNTIHWLTEIMKITQSVNLFKFIEIFEPDTAEVSNLLRFPKNPYIENLRSSTTHVSSNSKLKLLEPAELSLLSKEKPLLSGRRVDGNSLPYGSKGTYYDYNRSPRISRPKDNHIYYGAPNIETRASFENVGHFISATHSGNEAHLWLNPTQDTDLQVESYGLIQLTPFFMNQLRLAIGLMEILCLEDLDLTAKDQCLLEYSFDGVPRLSTNKTYNFQLGEHNGNVATETEAAQAW